ncbi:cell wall-binding repeat-containing protein [Planococcus sp. X10-3]|uniref:cell wall-binding repeat-containing protein n=1 Tax=Planococcus sp. X10-3 TaxID=3061240 RepID=UPI003BB082E1
MKTYIKLLSAIIVASLIFTMNESEIFANDETKVKSSIEETDRVIVKMEKQNTSALKAADITVLGTVDEGSIVTLEVPVEKHLNSFMEELEKVKGVESVEPDYLITLDYVPNDPHLSSQYHHNRIGAEKAWNLTKGSSDVLVAVIDGGFDVNHSDLVDQIYYSYSTVTDSYNLRVGNHGTHVAGIIGSSMDNNSFGTGVAPNTNLLLIEVFGLTTAYTSDVIEGIYLAVDAGADIINLSLGNYDYSSNLEAAIQYAHANGALIVAAAGNDDTKQRHYPSSYNNVIAVGATDAYDDITDYTNYGNYQDIVAPGTGIYSTLPHEGFGQMTGTSMAAPVVSGVAALILANEPHLTNVEVEKRLFSTATDDVWNPGKDIYYGHGLVNAYAAVRGDQPPEKAKRISGTNRYTTAVEISKTGWKSSEQVVLATAADFPDALAGGPLAYQEDAPILLTRTASLPPETRAEIRRLGAEKVMILGSKGAVSQEVEMELSRMGLKIERIGGKNRFDTAAMIAQKLDSTEAIIANGLNFPDVLSISSYASRNGIPILLTRKDSIPSETAGALQTISNTYVIGSTGVVDQSVFSQLPAPKRFGGNTRYETGNEVINGLPMGYEKAYIATGQNFPDALAGSVLAAKNNAPILLVKSDSVPAATLLQLRSYNSFGVFGGTGAVDDYVLGILNWELKN